MFKYISVLLLLVIVFLVGTIVGVEHKGESILPTFKEEQAEEVQQEVTHTVNTIEQQQDVVNEQMIAQELSMSNQDHLSQKTASFFEVIVQGFYDIIVEILYQISQLFF